MQKKATTVALQKSIGCCLSLSCSYLVLVLFLSVDLSLHQMSDQLLAVAFEHVDNRNLDHGVAAGLLFH